MDSILRMKTEVIIWIRLQTEIRNVILTYRIYKCLYPEVGIFCNYVGSKEPIRKKKTSLYDEGSIFVIKGIRWNLFRFIYFVCVQ